MRAGQTGRTPRDRSAVKKPIYFASTAEFRRWLRANHAKETELIVGFYKKHTRKPSMTWSEAVDEALCFGWIDGVRRGVDEDRYTNRFTPRKPKSNWSNINIAKVKALIASGRMQPAGLRAYEARDEKRVGVYSFEREKAARLSAADEKAFRSNRAAWKWFSAQPPGYRRTAYHWVISAKREETRSARLKTLIADSAAGLKVKPLRRPGV
jgi:uncharacterized protein YdeI (YjbR/CyaY-like superfamily)